MGTAFSRLVLISGMAAATGSSWTRYPYDWYDDEVYVEYVDGYGYALINPVFPGVYYHVGVRF